ncbi:hypothetical protein HOM13_00335, partial [Candidatus Woesearchaeota archaeon]|nr:hypothetical protein [Candidatus Woesearchaeota archaeon]
HNPRGRSDDKFIATSHEYLICYSKCIEKLKTFNLIQTRDEIKKKYPKNDAISRYRELPLKRSGSNSRRIDRPNLFYPIYFNPINNELSLEEKNDFIKILPLDSGGVERVWRWGKDKVKESFKTEFIVKKINDNYSIAAKDREKSDIKPKSLWVNPRYDASSHGTMLLKKLFTNNEFDYPKSLFAVMDSIQIGSNSGFILDFFAGSGTTGHAVLKLNKEDEGNRKFILVEMGEYFDTVTKPRILKVIYSDNWKNGKPQDSDGSKKQIVKYQTLEQYEDTLDNISFEDPNQLALARKDYQIKYMLNLESRNNNVFMNLEHLESPFDYRLNIDGKETNIDLVETFNYVAGIYVSKIEQLENKKQKYIIVKGKRKNKKVIVIWRNVKEIDRKEDKMFIESIISDEDEIFVNSDSLVKNATPLDIIFKEELFGGI